MNEKEGDRKFKAGVLIWMTPAMVLLILFLLGTVASATPHPIFGTAVYACGGGNADGANVEVVTDNPDVPPEDRVLTTIVGPAGGWGSGEWQVDCGDPGPNWPEGSSFTVSITGVGDYTGWEGTATGVVSGYYNDMGEITVYPPELVADADGPYSGLEGEPISFTGSATGGAPPYSWYWEFGDGNTSTEQNPTHVYSDAGSYTATLTVTDSCGTTDSDTASVQINPLVEADADGPYSGTICSPIQFTGSATGGCPPYSWYWDFGDGNTSTEQNPLHQYTNPGVYTVTLTVTDDAGYSDDDTTTADVTHPDVEADADGPYSGTICSPIQFTGSATGGCPPYSWYWDFGDGNTSTEQNPLHQYTNPGVYTVTLTVTDDAGYSDDDTTTADVTHPDVEADADGPYSGTVNTPIQFTGSATGGCPPYSWYWDFGDGGSSTEQNPTHTYSRTGHYTVTLTVTDDAGYSDDDTTTADVTSQLRADADGPYYGMVNQPVQFIGSATGGTPPYRWHWDFGDGGSSTEQNPTHVYTNTGDYTVTLTVTDSKNSYDTDTTTATITETPPPLTVDADGPYQGNISEPIQFTGFVTGGVPPYTYEWDFGDGNTSTEQNPVHAYNTAGVYTVVFTVTDSEGSTAADNTTATITAPTDTTPPTLDVTKPLKNSFYIKNNRILPFIGTWILGEIDIEVIASDESGVDRVEFYIDNMLKATDAVAPYTWTWSEKTFGRHTIKVVAYDTFGNHVSKEITVWKFF